MLSKFVHASSAASNGDKTLVWMTSIINYLLAYSLHAAQSFFRS